MEFGRLHQLGERGGAFYREEEEMSFFFKVEVFVKVFQISENLTRIAL